MTKKKPLKKLNTNALLLGGLVVGGAIVLNNMGVFGSKKEMGDFAGGGGATIGGVAGAYTGYSPAGSSAVATEDDRQQTIYNIDLQAPDFMGESILSRDSVTDTRTTSTSKAQTDYSQTDYSRGKRIYDEMISSVTDTRTAGERITDTMRTSQISPTSPHRQEVKESAGVTTTTSTTPRTTTLSRVSEAVQRMSPTARMGGIISRIFNR